MTGGGGISVFLEEPQGFPIGGVGERRGDEVLIWDEIEFAARKFDAEAHRRCFMVRVRSCDWRVLILWVG